MMLALVRSELRKITSTRLWWGLLIGAVVYTLIQAGASAALAGAEPGAGQQATPGLDTAQAIRSVYATATFSGGYIFAMILGITGMTGEYRYQTITPTFLATPRRSRVVAGKMGAHVLVGLGYGLAALVGALVVGGIVIAVRGHSLGYGAARLWPSIALAVVAVALWTLLGIGIGTLIRNQVAAILVAVFVTFLLEPLATFILAANDLDDVVKWLPTNASTALTSPGSTLVHYLPWWGGGLVLVGYAAVLAAVGILLSVRRDVT
jgi:ABC-type transport system involved in multi-copper enzyme maturation permease subunit